MLKSDETKQIDDAWDSLLVLCRLRGEYEGGGWSPETTTDIAELLDRERLEYAIDMDGKIAIPEGGEKAWERVMTLIARLPNHDP